MKDINEALKNIIADHRFYSWVQDHHAAFDEERYLRPWAEEKDKYLFKLMGNQLQLTRPYSYTKTEYEKTNEFEDNSRYQGHWQIYTRLLESATRNILNNGQYIGCNRALDDIYWDLISQKNAICNNVPGACYSFADKKITIHNNERWTKAVRKFIKFMRQLATSEQDLAKCDEASAAAEQVILDLSMINNSSTINADITLSIHPLDYLTMSDNDCNWQSCMSWDDEGCYHAGTVEMMNSPCVVIGYLNASESMRRNLWKHPNWEWNNKRWRCLFIVDKGFICGVKQYPYENQTLLDTMVYWLASLAKENLGWEYTGEIQRGKEVMRPFDEKPQSFITDLMYPDIHTYDVPALTWTMDNSVHVPLHYNYSGPAYCPICGNPLDIEKCSCCASCSGYRQCEDCGEWLDVDSLIETADGHYVCESCLEHDYIYCEKCNEYHYNDKMVEVSIAYHSPLRGYREEARYFCEDCLADLNKDYFDISYDNWKLNQDAPLDFAQTFLEDWFDIRDSIEEVA